METEEIKDPAAVLAELRRAQEDLKSLRAEHAQLQSDLESAREAVKAPDEWKSRAINAETKLALNAQGIKDTDRLMKYVGTDGLDFDAESGKLTGLDERMKQLRADLPEIFDPKRRVGGKADAFADKPAAAKENPLREQVRMALTGGSQ